MGARPLHPAARRPDRGRVRRLEARRRPRALVLARLHPDPASGREYRGLPEPAQGRGRLGPGYVGHQRPVPRDDRGDRRVPHDHATRPDRAREGHCGLTSRQRAKPHVVVSPEGLFVLLADVATTVALNPLDPHSLLRSGGARAVFLVIFAEPVLLMGFSLPGDSLLSRAGLLCSTSADASIPLSLPAVLTCAIAGALLGAQ